MKITFLNRQDFESLPHMQTRSITHSGECHSKEHHANGPEKEDRLKEIHDYGYATGIRDCVSVVVMPEDINKAAKLLHLNTKHFLNNLESIDKFIRQNLDVEDLKNSSALILGSISPVAEFGESYSEKQVKGCVNSKLTFEN